MTITQKDPAFYNGFDHFCSVCFEFFSVGQEGKIRVQYCPFCGAPEIINDHRELAKMCRRDELDCLTFPDAFPPDEPLPYSWSSLTPRQIRGQTKGDSNEHS
ncbi:MAG: hypothetical protein LBQ14_07030 [Treponema sp.]|jgi:hypothetical protein|nr:hypothetical protein [Treponema sp.]